MTFKATINQNKSTKQKITSGLLRALLIMCGLFVGVFSPVIFGNEIQISMAILLFLIFMSMLYFLFKLDYFKSTKKTGTIELSKNQLTARCNKSIDVYLLSEITDLRIYFHSYKDMRIGRAQLDGDMNKISFQFNGIKVEYQFDIDSLQHLEGLKRLFENFYQNSIKFKEYYWDQRSFMHNPNLSYAEVQEFKEKYDTDWL